MTLIIGIKCTNGIVIGADGAATLGTMGQRTILQPIKKLQIISKSIILGVSGPVGLGQRFKGELQKLWEEKKFSGKKPFEAMGILRQALWKHAEGEWKAANVTSPIIGNISLQSVLTHSIIALPISKEPCLFQFDQQCAPEEATEDLPFISTGSVQNIADPFLAFIRRVFWPKGLPSINSGIFATVWTLRHAIKTAPGGVAEPTQIVKLQKGNSNWQVQELPSEELEEHIEASSNAEKHLSEFKKETVAKEITTDKEIPVPESKEN